MRVIDAGGSTFEVAASEICTCFVLRCKIVALEAPSTALSRQAKVYLRRLGHLIAVYLLTLLPNLKLRLKLPLCGADSYTKGLLMDLAEDDKVDVAFQLQVEELEVLSRLRQLAPELKRQVDCEGVMAPQLRGNGRRLPEVVVQMGSLEVAVAILRLRRTLPQR